MAAGVKTGGRKKGTPNKATTAKAAEIAASGLTPLDFMLNVLRDETRQFDDRMDAAKAAAPYCHPKLQMVDAKLDGALNLTGTGPIALQCNREQ